MLHRTHKGTRYSEEFKRLFIDLYLFGKSDTELEKKYDLVEQIIYKWKKLYAPAINVDEKQTISMKEYKYLQGKMRELKTDNKT